MHVKTRLGLSRYQMLLPLLLACCLLLVIGCAAHQQAYRCEIAWHNYNPRARDAHVQALEDIQPPVFAADKMPFEDVLGVISEAGILCSAVYAGESDSCRLLTVPAKTANPLAFIDSLCEANALCWMACGSNSIFLVPTERLNAGYVRVLPANANWANPVISEFSRELVREGESPVARNRTVRIMEHETIPDVRFASTPFGDAVEWLCRQGGVMPLIFISETGVPSYPVSLDMANASLFTVLDEICRQSRNYWGFVDGKLAVISSEAFITNDRWRLPRQNTGEHDLRQGQTYKRELVRRDHNPVLRDKMHFLVNDGLIPSVNLTDMPVMDAIRWLSKQCAQSYSARLTDEDATNRVVNLSMTSATFLSAFDEVCEQSDWYWGFLDRILMTFPAAHLEQKTNHPEDAEWIRIQGP